MKILRYAILRVFTILILAAALSGTAAAELTVNANHNHITIDFFYHGSTVGVSGTADAGTDIIVRIASPEGREALKQKGKVAGFLWMNVGTLEFDHVPSLYFVHSTRPVEEILNREEQDRHGLGYLAIERRALISPVSNADEKGKWFHEFLRYKESLGLYGNSSGKITVEEKQDRQAYSIKTDWPYQAPPGEYLVTVYGIKGHKVVETVEAMVKVEQIGMVKSLASMARNNGAVYGAVSILAALGAGFGVGMIFRKGGGAH